MPIQDDLVDLSGRRHPVPQNVMDVEFKVVGDLTVRQVMYLFVGGIIVFVFYKSGLPGFWRWIFMIIVGSVSAAVAFLPYQERGLDKWLIIFIQSITSPAQRVWKKTYSPPAYFLSDYAQIIKNEIITLTPAKSRSKLDKYLGQLPGQKTELDIREEERLSSISGIFKASSHTEPVLEFQPRAAESLTVTVEQDEAEEQTEVKEEQKIKDIPETPPATKPPTAIPPVKPAGSKEQERKSISLPQIQKDELATKEAFAKLASIQPVKTTQPSVKPAEPEEDFGRKKPINRVMLNLPSTMTGEIPISTTTKLPSVIVLQDLKDIHEQEEDLNKRMSELLEITQKAQEQFIVLPKGDQRKEQRISFFEDKYKELKTEKEDLASKLTKSTKKIEHLEAEPPESPLKQEVDLLKQQNHQLEEQLQLIQSELAQLKNPQTPKPQAASVQDNGADITARKVLTGSEVLTAGGKKVPPTGRGVLTLDSPVTDAIQTTEPNIIAGIVKDKEGSLTEEAVVLVKDKEGDVVRALKTNKLGQFKTQTPVKNGKYTIEVIKGKSKFDIIAVEARGEVIKPIQMIESR